MKVHKVSVAGFGPFRERQIVDFDSFVGDGLFLIAGPTGAGKSSILDAIIYGLYGTTPRYSGSGETRYRSDFAQVGEPTEVQVEFTTGDTRYRVTRCPEYTRPAKRGAGLSIEKATAQLEQQIASGDWQGIEALPRNVGTKVQELIGLTSSQFLQVMLLAQNRFSEFLLADTKERRTLLKQLFGAERFEFYETYLDDLRRAREAESQSAQQLLTATVAQLEGICGSPKSADQGLTEWLPFLVQTTTTDLETAEQRQQVAAAELATAQTALAQAKTLLALQERRNTALAALAATQGNQPVADAWGLALAAHQRGALVAPYLRAWQTSQSQAERADQQILTTQAKLQTSSSQADVSHLFTASEQQTINSAHPEVAKIATIRDNLLTQIATLNPILAVELTLPGLKQQAGNIAAELNQSQTNRTELLAQIETAKSELAVAQISQDENAPIAALLESRQLNYQQASDTHRLIAGLPSARQDVEKATEQAATCATAQQQAANEVSRLWAARLAGAAAELAGELAPGQPCLVCGATNHPHPAQATGEVVTPELVEQAQSELERLGALATQANRKVTEAERKLASLETAIGETDIVTAAAKVEQAQVELDAAKAANQELARAKTVITKTQTLITNLNTQAETYLNQIQVLTGETAATQTKLTEAEQQVSNALDGWPNLATRVKTLQTAEQTVAELVTALRTSATAKEQEASAQADLTESLATQGFAAAADAEAAILAPAKRSEIEKALADHNRNHTIAQATLAEPELQNLPDDVVDIAPLLTAEQVAVRAAADSAAHLGAVRERQTTVTRLATQATGLAQTYEQVNAETQTVKRLADSLHGAPPNDRKMRLIDFVLAAELEQIVLAANGRLARMRSGRYSLEHTDDRAKAGAQSGLGLRIIDAHTGKSRPTESLSGGERFLASLALALGLAETVSNRNGGISLDTLFIDEGFGSLDPDTLETAMETLYDLHERGRTVGVISHVETMHERIPAQIKVRVTPEGHSEVIQ